MREQPPPPGRLFKPHLSNVVLSGLCTELSGLFTVAEVVFLTSHLPSSPKFLARHFWTIFYNQKTFVSDTIVSKNISNATTKNMQSSNYRIIRFILKVKIGLHSELSASNRRENVHIIREHYL